MKYITVFLLFYTLTISQGNVIKGQQWTYTYKGQIDASSSACNQSLARWTISGTIIGQSFDKYMVFKLENLKTSLFNGDVGDLKNSEEKSIPAEAEILYKPFVVHKKNDALTTIDVTPGEPLWSLNMKRAIGSHFQINFERGFDDGEFIEHSLYGDCSIYYISNKIGKDIIVNKVIDHDKCKNNPFKHKANVKKAEPMKYYEPLKIETVKKYFLKDLDSVLMVGDTYSNSNITYKPMPSLPYSQDIHQYQKFKLINHSKVDQLINVDEATETHNITYEIDMESLYGKQEILTPENQINKLYDSYENLKTKFNLSLEHFNMSKEDYVETMYLVLSNMKTDTLLKLNEEIKGREDLFNITLLTLIPYIGTVDTTNYIIESLKSGLNYEGSEYLGVKFLATFPKYIEDPTEDTLKKFEFLLDLKSNQILKNAAILSFSNIVQTAIDKKTINNAKIEDYKNMFYNKFKNEELYETKMTYLLCLVNIGEIFDTNDIIDLLINTSESEHLRALGITGFKNRLIHESELTFDKFWRIVQNETEAFDVRVAALDLLLSSDLNREQFYKIVDVFKKTQKGIYNKHLFHYFHTAMITLQNTTRYTDPLGALATELFQNDEFRDFRLNAHAWTTSKIRLAYTDDEPNFGRNFEGKLIADPITNSIYSLQLSYNYFTMSFDMGTYSIYLKFDKAFEILYKKDIIQKIVDTDVTIPDLLDLIKEFNFKMKNEDIQFHAEIVVFIDNKAIASIHMHPENFEIILKTIIYGISLTENKQEARVSYPLIDYIAFPSDLGTPLTVKNDMQDIFIGKHPKLDLVIRDYWYHQIWFESYNPIVGSPIASYRYYGQDISVDILMDVNLRNRKTSGFYHSNDSIQMVYDKIIGTSVEGEELLKTYCSECTNYYEIPNDVWTNEKLEKIGLLAISFNITRGKRDVFTNTSDEYVKYFYDSHHSNADTLTISKPFLLTWHFLENQYYFQNELTRRFYRSVPYFQDTTMTLIKFKNHNEENLDKHEIIQASTYNNYSIDFSSSSVEDDYVKLHWVADFVYRTIIENINDVDKPKIPKTILNFDFDFVIYNETRFKVAIERNLTFPQLNSDKFSITPAEPTIGNTVIRYCNLPENATDCLTNTSVIAKEKFWISDERKSFIKKSDDYETCLKQKNGLEFTPPTRSCVLHTHTPLHQYDHYEMYAGYYDELESQEFDIPTLTYSIPSSQSKMEFAILKNQIMEVNGENQYWNNTINYWHMHVNPNAISYNDYEVLVGIKRSCIISPNTIKTLTGAILDFDQSKPVALVECLKKPLRGLKIQKIDDKHVGFKFWALSNQLTVTVYDGQLKITLNGNEIKSTFYDEENKFKITFLDKNVLIISESEIEIYYNTEYLYTKLGAKYSSRLCGFCTNN